MSTVVVVALVVGLAALLWTWRKRTLAVSQTPKCPVDHGLQAIPGETNTPGWDFISPLRQLLSFRGAEGDWVRKARAAAGGGGVFRAEAGIPLVVITDPVAAQQALESSTELVDRGYHNGFGPTEIRPSIAGRHRPSLTTRGPGDRPERKILIEWSKRRATAVREYAPKALARVTRDWTVRGQAALPEAMGDLLGDIIGTSLLGAAMTGRELFDFNAKYLTARTTNSLSNWIGNKTNPADKASVALGESLQRRFVNGPLYEEASALGSTMGLEPDHTANLITMMGVLNGGTASTVFCGSALVELTRHPVWISRILDEVGDGPIDPAVLDDSDLLQRVFTELHRLFHRPRAFFKAVQSPFVLTDSAGKNYQLSPGDALMIHASTAHRDPSFFPNPSKFDPDRYLERPELKQFVWGYGSWTQDNYSCVGQMTGIADHVYLIVLATLLRDFRWRYAVRPTLNLNNGWDIGPEPVTLVDFRERLPEDGEPSFPVVPSASAPGETVKRFGFVDRLKLRGVMAVRAVNRVSLERWSRKTFRDANFQDEDLPPLTSAAAHYESDILPEVLKVPEKLPIWARLRATYVFPYYILTGVLFKAYRALPLSEDVDWTPDASWNDWFPPHPEGWHDITSDDDYTAMRVQGPNPFLLTKAGRGKFELDFGPTFEGVYDPVKATFKVVKNKGLKPVDIKVGDEVFKPGGDGWERAKFIVNGLDARYTVFLRHLVHTHLISGQSFSIASYSLASDHPFRPFVDYFTYGTLMVNDYAFKLLVTPASYFLQSNFLDGAEVGKLFENYAPHYTLDKLIPPKDIETRGIGAIPNHPYVEDATKIWDVITGVVRNYVTITHRDDEDVSDDARLQVWYAKLLELLPDRSLESHPLNSLDALVEIFSAMIYLNVYHEVCGDFSPFTAERTVEGKKLINFDNLRNPHLGPPRARDVFLFDQGAWAGRFDNGGNFLMTMDLDGNVRAETLRKSLTELQGRLRELDRELEQVNRGRRIPFLRLQPRRWKASISY